MISFGHLWVVELACFIFSFLSSQQLDNCSYCLPPVLFTPVANLPPASTTLAKMVEKFAVGVVDTGCKFAASVIDTGGSVVDTGSKFATGVVDTGGAP
jgi:hypothetical protein